MKLSITFLAVLFICASTGLLAETARAEGPSPPLTSGTYRLEMHMASRSKFPIVGWLRSSTVSVSIAKLTRHAGAWTQTHRVCQISSGEPGDLVRMIFPQKFIGSLARPVYPLELSKNGSGWEYRADLGLEYIGYRPNGNEGKLPTQTGDPEVFDWDGDNEPGATLVLTIPIFPDGELFVVQRGRSILEGRIVKPDHVEGKINVPLFEQKVLGAKPSFFNRTPEIVPDSDRSRFVMTRVAEGTNCETVVPYSPPPQPRDDVDDFDRY